QRTSFARLVKNEVSGNALVHDLGAVRVEQSCLDKNPAALRVECRPLSPNGSNQRPKPSSNS
ncbi:MAG: hypothetical protein KC978_04675, partial [Candidatus Omnitrophica bacterium]|nr:hypothetical protein [Candidatus Omnitrophota bacterium]